MSSDEPQDGTPPNRQGARPSFRFRGLKVQIVLWMVLPLTLVLIGVAFTGVYSHEQAMRELVEERDRALAVVSANQVRDLLRTRITALQTLAAEQAIHHRDDAAQKDLLAQAGTLNSLFADAVALLDESGNPLATGANSPPWVQDSGVPDLAREVMAHMEPIFATPSDAPGSDDLLLLGIPVYDEKGTSYGVLAAPVSLSSLELETLLAQVQVGEHGVAYLVDASGQILAHYPAEHARENLTGHTGLAVALADEGSGATRCLSSEGERMTLAYAPTGLGLGWRVLIEQPWHEVIGPILRYSQFMPLVAALAVLVSLLTLYYGVRAIVQPLQALGQQAERVAWGDFDAVGTPVGGVEEIEDLRRTLDQMAKRIQRYQGGMHDYIAAITRGQEEERKRLARELHDETAQALIALGQRVEMAQKALSTDPQRAAERLSRVQVMLTEMLEEVRRFSRALRPIYLEDLGFIPALEMLTREAGQPEAPPVHFATIGPVRRLPPDLELAAYRMVQEALNNVLQHAQASQAWVEVRFEAEHLVLSVRDDGQGFEAPDLPDALARQGHYGLMGIQERAHLYGGQLAIHSAPDGGTQITVRLPYPG